MKLQGVEASVEVSLSGTARARARQIEQQRDKVTGRLRQLRTHLEDLRMLLKAPVKRPEVPPLERRAGESAAAHQRRQRLSLAAWQVSDWKAAFESGIPMDLTSLDVDAACLEDVNRLLGIFEKDRDSPWSTRAPRQRQRGSRKREHWPPAAERLLMTTERPHLTGLVLAALVCVAFNKWPQSATAASALVRRCQGRLDRLRRTR